jgi:DNA gyrase subunit B
MSTKKTITKTNKSYNVSDISVLEGLDAVRKRPGMYIGSTDSRGLQHCLWEIIDNSVDEALAGHATRISIVLHVDGSAEVTDNGRGVPVDKDSKTGLSGVELVFTKLHAGGKFSSDGGYAVSGGLHGVGASVVNALSSRVDATVKRDSKVYAVSFNKGIPGSFDKTGKFKPGTLQVVDKCKASDTGTSVRFWPDKGTFIAASEFDLQAVSSRARQTAFLVPSLTLEVLDLRVSDSHKETFHYEGGVKDFVEYIATDPEVCAPLVIYGEGSYSESIPVLENDTLIVKEVARTCEVEIALRWGSGYETQTRSFVNIIATPKGGTHVTGFERALVRTIADGACTSRAVKANEENPTKDDVLEGMTAVVLVRISEPQFEGQTKEILGTPAISAIVAQVVEDGLLAWASSKKTKNDARKVYEKVAVAGRARRAARLQRETVRRKNALESSSLPAKLSDCRSSDMEHAELFIIEGDSAGGTVKAARDSEFQALLPIRGKILNTMRASEKQMLDNQECAAIISAMGAGSGKSFNLANLRYGKLIVLADADVDGSHIRCLLLTLAYRYMRPLLEEGRVYAAVPPLYRIETSLSKEYIYCYSDAEREDALAHIKKLSKQVKDIQRYKGLGEMDADQLAETTLDTSRRKLRRMTLKDASAADTMFSVLMGQDVSARRDYIVSKSPLMDQTTIDV